MCVSRPRSSPVSRQYMCGSEGKRWEGTGWNSLAGGDEGICHVPCPAAAVAGVTCWLTIGLPLGEGFKGLVMSVPGEK